MNGQSVSPQRYSRDGQQIFKYFYVQSLSLCDFQIIVMPFPSALVERSVKRGGICLTSLHKMKMRTEKTETWIASLYWQFPYLRSLFCSQLRRRWLDWRDRNLSCKSVIRTHTEIEYLTSWPSLSEKGQCKRVRANEVSEQRQLLIAIGCIIISPWKGVLLADEMKGWHRWQWLSSLIYSHWFRARGSSVTKWWPYDGNINWIISNRTICR